MGKGTMNDQGGLTLFLQFIAGFSEISESELSQWNAAFECYSMELHRATYGQVFIEQII
jgi:hypothetical protein